MQRFSIISCVVGFLRNRIVAVLEICRVLRRDSRDRTGSKELEGGSGREYPNLGSNDNLVSYIAFLHPFSNKLFGSFVLVAIRSIDEISSHIVVSI